MALNFVKFQRGSAAAYENLKRNNRLESDALYFIYDSSAPEEGGLLYLGDVLIGGTSSAVNSTALSDLTDVNLSGTTLLDGMILQYNATSHQWTPIANSELRPIVASGTQVDGQSIQDVLDRIDPNPIEGDIVFVNNVPYISDGTQWRLLVGQDLEERVSTLEMGLEAVDGKIDAAIARANHLSYQVVSTLPTITQDNTSTLTNKVFLVPNGESTGDDRYEEYMLVNGNYEKLGTFGADLDDYVTVTTFNTDIGNLQTSINNLRSSLDNYVLVSTYEDEVGDVSDLRTATGDNDITIVEEIVELHDRLIWHDMTE